jgi:hypothetical protein
MKNADYAVLFYKLREILAKYEPSMKVKCDDDRTLASVLREMFSSLC